MPFKKAYFLLISVLFISCGGTKTAQIWTDSAEFALYGEYFNSVQNQYKVTVRYFDLPAAEMEQSGKTPDIVVGRWLKSASMRVKFNSLNNLFRRNRLSSDNFYPRILDIGRHERNQLFLPVSFNIPALIFSKSKGRDISNSFTIDFNEVKTLSRNFNVINRGAYTRMGFSPLWNDNFLFTAAVLSGASFREAHPLAWDAVTLDRLMDFIFNWTQEINTGNQEVEDFTFKYFFEPPERLIQSERIFFSYMESRDLFTMSEDSKNLLDFRWIMEQNRVPLNEDMIFLGIPKKAKSKGAARAFILWFFQVESQRLLMEYSRSKRLSENVFGICGGFSALIPVTEQIFPRFYPELLGRMPPSENFMAPNILPGNWAAIKERVILPYLNDRARSQRADDIYSLERRLSDWMRINI